MQWPGNGPLAAKRRLGVFLLVDNGGVKESAVTRACPVSSPLNEKQRQDRNPNKSNLLYRIFLFI